MFKINKKGVLLKYIGGESDVIIPAIIDGIAVKTIYSNAFMDKNIKSVVIPEGIERINSRAFCKNKLTKIILPQSLIRIGDWAFAENELSEVVIPENVKEIGHYAFRVNKLMRVDLPQNLKKIGQFAFMFSENGFMIEFPKGVLFKDNRMEKSESAVAYKETKELIIPEKINGIAVNQIGDRAFTSSNIENVVIPEGVREIYSYAFSYNNLQSVIIPQSVKSISRYAFCGNSITEIVIPKNVKVHEEAFDDAFDVFYNGNKRKNGTYIYDMEKKIWSKKE